ncbi:phosphatidylglycerophosphatase A family protein [Litoribrevibacter albus]|uniref:Phosphatidylglycerophosphatase A n=1 Tax=Litoribrevibacter albus TaxID=1473156 RepID=A0AA37SF85_9GAMM|nr:phosphatidylglycerophosphatase A [Litoribrevibacter albus]GLQ33440.1 phosphatidylglycerophosphatase A [Litoribrevibacter albus]
MGEKIHLSPIEIIKDPVHFFAFGLGSGLSPKAPGTFGTLMALVIYWFMLADMSLYWYIAVVVSSIPLGIYLCGESARRLGVHDYGGIVWDEFSGLWITFIFAPKHWLVALIGFALFRFFDIIKPWPIKWADQKVSGGLGIMLDDILAGLMSLIVLQLLLMSNWLPL